MYVYIYPYKLYRCPAGRVSGSVGGKIQIFDNEHDCTPNAMQYAINMTHQTKCSALQYALYPITVKRVTFDKQNTTSQYFYDKERGPKKITL